jgi:putative FmdB family regulatory protein
MPIYSYHCEQCDEVYENMRSIKQRDVKLICPQCKESCSRILDLSAFQLKGGGWYKDGYSSKKQNTKKEEKEE